MSQGAMSGKHEDWDIITILFKDPKQSSCYENTYMIQTTRDIFFQKYNVKLEVEVTYCI